MAACPVCENPQAAGEACDVCGHALALVGRGVVAIDRVDGLEPTLHPSVVAAREEVPGLEPTRAADVGAAALPGSRGERIDGLEPTGHAVGPDLPSEPGEPVDLEPTAADPVPGDGAAPSPLVCRYCRTPAAGGELLCLRCGMRLPRARPPRVREAVRPVCSDCGTPLASGRCPACGARN